MCERVKTNSGKENVCGCVMVYRAPQSLVPRGRNAAISPLAKEGVRQGEKDVGEERAVKED